jgi:hypothetical protein
VHEGFAPSPLGCAPKEHAVDLNSIIGLILLLLLVGFIAFRHGIKWLEMRERIRSLTMKLKVSEARAEQLDGGRQELRKSSRKLLLCELGELKRKLRDCEPSLWIQSLSTITYTLGSAIALWKITEPNSSATRWGNELARKILLANEVTTGDLATWRTEVSAAQIYLLRLDSSVGIGNGSGSGGISDEELNGLVELKGGMCWIIDRRGAGNCPFPFSRYIDHDLKGLIWRIEALESKSAAEV